MFTLESLPKITKKANKRLGRGYGSGKGGHTSSRGQKGQKTRETAKLLFEGTKTNKDFFRRTPMLRGKSKLKSFTKDPVILKSSALVAFKDGDTVDMKALVKAKLVTAKEVEQKGVKIVFNGDPKRKLILQIPATKTVLLKVQAQ